MPSKVLQQQACVSKMSLQACEGPRQLLNSRSPFVKRPVKDSSCENVALSLCHGHETFVESESESSASGSVPLNRDRNGDLWGENCEDCRDYGSHRSSRLAACV